MQDLDSEKRKGSFETDVIEVKDPEQLRQANKRLQEQIMQTLTQKILHAKRMDGNPKSQDSDRTRQIKEVAVKLASKLKQCVGKQDSLGRAIRQMRENYNQGNWQKDKIEPTEDSSLLGDGSGSKVIHELQEDVRRLELEREGWFEAKLGMEGNLKKKGEMVRELQDLLRSKEDQFSAARQTLQSEVLDAKKAHQDFGQRVQFLEGQLKEASLSLQGREQRVSELDAQIQTIGEKFRVDSQQLTERVEDKARQRAELETAIGQLRVQNNQLLQAIDSTRRQLTIQSQKGETDRAALNELRSQLLQFKQDRILKDSWISSLQVNSQQSVSQIEQLRHLLQTKETQLAGLTRQWINNQQFTDVLQKEKNGMKEQYGYERNQLLETVRALNADIDRLNSDKQEIRSHSTQASLNLDEQSKIIHQLRQEAQLLANDLQKQGLLESRVKQLIRCLDQEANISSKLTQQNSQLRLQVVQLTRQNQEAGSSNIQYAEDVDSLQTQLVLQKRQIESLINNQLQLNAKLRSSEIVTLQKDQQIAEGDRELGLLKDSIASLQGQLAAAEARSKSSEQVYINSTQQASRLAEQLESARIVSEQREEELAQFRLQNQLSVANYGKHQEQMESSNDVLEGKVTSLTQQLNLKQCRLFQMESLLQRLKQENATLAQEKVEHEEIIILNQTRQRSTQLQEKSLIQQKRNKIGELQGEVSDLKERLYYLQEFEARVSEQKLTIESQMGTINSSSAAQQMMSLKSKELQEALQSMSTDNSSMRVEIQRVSSQRQIYQDQVIRLETTLKGLQREFQRTHTQILSRRSQVDGLNTQIQNLKQTNGLLQTENYGLIEYKETLQRQLYQSKAQINSVRVQLEQLEAEKAGWLGTSQSQIKHLKEQLSAMIIENTELNNKSGQFLNNSETVRQQLRLSRQELQQSKRSVTQISTVANQRQEQIQRLSLVNTQISSALQSLKLEGDQSRQQLGRSQEIVAALEHELQASKEEANLTTNRLQQSLLRTQTLQTDNQRWKQVQRNTQRLRQQNDNLQEALVLKSEMVETAKEKLQQLTLWNQGQPTQEQLRLLRQEIVTLKDQADTDRSLEQLNSELISKSSHQVKTLKATEIELRQQLASLSAQLLQLPTAMTRAQGVQSPNVDANTNAKNMASALVFQVVISPVRLELIPSPKQPSSQSKELQLSDRVAQLQSQLSQARAASLITKPTFDFVLEQNTESIIEQITSLEDNQLLSLKKSCACFQKRVQDLEAQISLKECALLWVKNTLLDQNKWAHSEEWTRAVTQKNIGLEFKNYMRMCEQNQYLRKCLQKFTGSDAFWDQIVEQRENTVEQIQSESVVQVEDQKCLMF